MVLPLCASAINFFSSSNNAVLFVSDFNTASLADVSSATTSVYKLMLGKYFGRHFEIFFLFVPDRICHFMQIVSLGQLNI